jgi:hypothetical protein
MADKKITELPFIDTLSGSLVGDNTPLQNTVIPLVLRGNTNQINIENFSKFVTAYSAHTGSAGNIFTGPQTINNNVTINGRLTVREVVAEYETASILFSTGSTKLGDEITDRHEFTGSTNITGSFIVNGANLTDFSASNSTLFTNYSSSVSESISSYSSSNAIISENYSASNSTTFTNLSSSNSTTFTNLSSSNSTTFTNLSSSNSTLFTNYSSSVSESISSYSSSNSTTFTNLSSSNSTTFTNYSSSTADSIDGLSLGISTELARLYQTTASLNVQTGSQNSLNTSLGLITSSIYGEITSFNSVFQRIGSTTSSMNTQSGSQDLVNLGISTYTGSQNVINSSVDAHILKQATQTGSQDLVNLGISSVTGSLIGITNGLMAFTAALDNTYATDEQLYQLYQATSSIHSTTGSLNIQTGSQDLVNLGISTYTGSQNVINSSVDSHILKQATQTGSQDLVNLGISTYTGSNELWKDGVRGEVNGLEAYTASLKGAAIVSSSTQISNYYKFAETASNNTFYGNQTISGSLIVTASANLSGSVVINGLTYPTADFADGQHGVEVPTLGVNNVLTMEVPKTIYEYVKNDSGTTLLKGTPVHSTGTVGFNTLVIAASASVASTMPATYILAQDLDDEEEGLGIAIGAIQGVNTTGLIAGDAVYVGANGGWTQTKPTGSNLIQNLGIVTKVGTNGGGVVLGAGRSNDVPNIQQGYIWVGNVDSVATATPTSSFELSGRGVVSGSNQLPQIAGLQEYTASLKGAAIVSSSQQITNYYKFAETASANTFYANQTIVGSIIARSGNFTAPNNVIGTLLIQGGKEEGGFGEINSRLDFGSNDPSVGENDGIKSGGRISSVIENANGAHVGMAFSTYQQGRTPDLREEVRITNTGDLTLNNGNLVVANGKGIDFSATSNSSGTMTSELLNDYEEGTWSPQIYYQNATDQSNSTNVTQIGTYIKVGNVVTVIGVLQWTVTGSPVNDNIGIKNFPFTSKTGADYIWWGNVQLVNAGAYPTDGYILRMDNNTTYSLFYDRRSDAGNYGDDIGASGTKTARFTITYFT